MGRDAMQRQWDAAVLPQHVTAARASRLHLPLLANNGRALHNPTEECFLFFNILKKNERWSL
jgi:hypothetical protein